MDTDWITITDGEWRAAINPRGAELSSLTDAAGREWMTDADPAFWAGRAPLLFPIVGALRDGHYRIGDRLYAMPQHGFARRRVFEVRAQAADCVTLGLRDDAASLAIYPFAFEFEVRFQLIGGVLAVTCTVTNRGDGPMPASFGYHPAFAWPLPGAADKTGHRIVFDAREPEALAVLEDGLIAGERPSPLASDGRTLALDDALFERDALIWRGPASRAVDYCGPAGARLRVEFPDAHDLGVWTKPGAHFVCIEPWWGLADPAEFQGDLFEKPGMLMLEPGDRRQFEMRLIPCAAVMQNE